MDYIVKIDTPKETAAANPKETTLHLTAGFLSGGFLYFPSGPAGTLQVSILHGLTPIAPVNQGKYYALDDCVIPLDIKFPILEPPYLVTIKTLNSSTDYTHSVTVGLFLDPFIKKISEGKKRSLFSRLMGRGE